MRLVPETDIFQTKDVPIEIAYAGSSLKEVLIPNLSSRFTLVCEHESLKALETYLNNQSLLTLPGVILIEPDDAEYWVKLVEKIKQNALLRGLVIVLISQKPNTQWRKKALSLKIHDFYVYPFPLEDLYERLNFLVNFKLIKPQLAELSLRVDVTYKVPPFKRMFDIVASGIALLVLSPLFLMVAIAIRLDSKGPIIYKSRRVGTGYKIFYFYKFRSMHVDADEHLSNLAAERNQYTGSEQDANNATFIKITNDPRITRIGKLLRNTSIDELPQLVNVFKGDMSLVGNRPLPLYEAERLTSNEWSMRFLGPAGLTGLWQISKRGKKNMSERERKKLDNFYAAKHSFWLDLKIIIGTIPALLQRAKV